MSVLTIRYSGNMSDLRDAIIVGSGPAGYTELDSNHWSSRAR